MPPVKIIDNGPDSDRMVFVVLGDGYAEADQATYRSDVQRLVVNGVLANDVYAENQRAFNVYRADLVSAESGVSTPSQTKDTALKLVFTGQWSSCWISESDESAALISAAVSGIDYKYILLMCNESEFGGCRRGSRMYITSGVDWDLVAHEYGHSIAGLYDEYDTPYGEYTGPEINEANCSNVLDRERVVWRALIAAETPIPTTLGGGVGANTVGMFEGCNTYRTGIYRPADNCLMRESGQDSVPPFCPVCRPILTSAISPFLPRPGQRVDDDFREARRDAVTERVTEAMNEDNNVQHGSYLFVEIRITADGDFEVLSAQEMPGTPVMQKAPISRFAYEVLAGQKTLSVETLPEDPFLVRCFPDPAQNKPHRYDRSETAILTLRIPIAASALEREPVGLRLYRVEPNTDVNTIDIMTLDKMSAAGRLELRTELPADKLGPAIAQKLDRR